MCVLFLLFHTYPAAYSPHAKLPSNELALWLSPLAGSEAGWIHAASKAKMLVSTCMRLLI